MYTIEYRSFTDESGESGSWIAEKSLKNHSVI